MEKQVIKDSYIQKQIDDHRCPNSLFFCTVATTGYEKHERERTCLKCWVRYCRENDIEIDYYN